MKHVRRQFAATRVVAMDIQAEKLAATARTRAKKHGHVDLRRHEESAGDTVKGIIV